MIAASFTSCLPDFPHAQHRQQIVSGTPYVNPPVAPVPAPSAPLARVRRDNGKIIYKYMFLLLCFKVSLIWEILSREIIAKHRPQ
jgi:hypothetical protein